MLQLDAFCQHTMQQNATAAGALPRTPLGSLQRSPDFLAGFKGEAAGGGERKGDEREGRLTLMCSWNRAADWLRPALKLLRTKEGN